MAAPLRALSASASRALPFIESGIARGLSTSALQSELSAAGLGVRRTDLLAAVRGIRDAELAADRLKFVRYDYRPDPSQLASAVTKQLREYSFKVKVSGYDPVTGVPADRYFSISTNDLLSRGEIESIALGHSTNTDRYAPFEPEDAELLTATVQ